MGQNDVELTEDLKEMVEVLCRGGSIIGGSAAAAVITGGSGTVAALIAGTAATGGTVVVALIGGAVLGIVAGKFVCPTLSRKFIDTVRTKIGGEQALLSPERRLLRYEVERQIGFGVTDSELDQALIYVGNSLRADHSLYSRV